MIFYLSLHHAYHSVEWISSFIKRSKSTINYVDDSIWEDKKHDSIFRMIYTLTLNWSWGPLPDILRHRSLTQSKLWNYQDRCTFCWSLLCSRALQFLLDTLQDLCRGLWIYHCWGQNLNRNEGYLTNINNSYLWYMPLLGLHVATLVKKNSANWLRLMIMRTVF